VVFDPGRMAELSIEPDSRKVYIANEPGKCWRHRAERDSLLPVGIVVCERRKDGTVSVSRICLHAN
jgi:hypothetical protein